MVETFIGIFKFSGHVFLLPFNSFIKVIIAMVRKIFSHKGRSNQFRVKQKSKKGIKSCITVCELS